MPYESVFRNLETPGHRTKRIGSHRVALDKDAIAISQLHCDFGIGKELVVIVFTLEKDGFPLNGLSGPVNGAVGINRAFRTRWNIQTIIFSHIVNPARKNGILPFFNIYVCIVNICGLGLLVYSIFRKMDHSVIVGEENHIDLAVFLAWLSAFFGFKCHLRIGDGLTRLAVVNEDVELFIVISIFCQNTGDVKFSHQP